MVTTKEMVHNLISMKQHCVLISTIDCKTRKQITNNNKMKLRLTASMLHLAA